MLCDSKLRLPLASMLSRTIPPLSVVAYDEIVLGTEVEPIEIISIKESELAALQGRKLVTVP